MQIALHLGAHFTDPSALLRSLRCHEAELAREGIALPGPSAYLPMLMAATHDPPGELRERIRLPAAERVVLSGEDLLGPAEQAVVDGVLYPAAAERVRKLTSLFPQERIELHLAIRSPATFLPSLLQNADPERVRQMLDGMNIETLRWSDLVARLREAAPKAPVTVWCDEDMPLIWPEALAAVSGSHGRAPMAGLLDRLGPLLTEEGARQMASYLSTYPPEDAETRRAIVTSFLNRFGRREAIEMDLDLPGWTPATIDRLSDLYEDDIERIAGMEGVHLITP